MRQIQHVVAAGVPVVGDTSVRVDARPSPWPDNAITERRSLLGLTPATARPPPCPTPPSTTSIRTCSI